MKQVIISDLVVDWLAAGTWQHSVCAVYTLGSVLVLVLVANSDCRQYTSSYAISA